MSKAEFFQQLESLSLDELDDVAIRVEELRRSTSTNGGLTPSEREIIKKRFERFEADGNSGEEWQVVRDRVLGKVADAARAA